MAVLLGKEEEKITHLFSKWFEKYNSIYKLLKSSSLSLLPAAQALFAL